jgi:DNA-nicking Smr family endonuclease
MAAEIMNRRRSLSEEERALWSGVARSITPLRQATERPELQDRAASANAAAPADTSAPAPAPVTRLARQAASPAEKPPPLAPLGRRYRQRVASGRTPIDARLDLHGLTQKQAHAALLRFLRSAQADGAKVVLVVTGKGTLRKPLRGDYAADPMEPGVLRRQVPMWLALPEFRPFVVSVEDAHAAHGGQGALYVRLRRVR